MSVNLFSITDISDGWFETRIFDEYKLLCSDLWLADPQASFLSALYDVYASECERYISFKGEPGADILKMISECNKLHIYVYNSLSASESMLPNEGAELEKYMGKLLYEKSVDKDDFVKAVLAEFERYADGEMKALYEKNWELFPQKEFDRLKSMI